MQFKKINKYSEMNNLKYLAIYDICLEDLGYK